MSTTTAYGLWPSTLSASLVAGSARRFESVACDGPWIYWSEGRPEEQGRMVIMRAKVDGGMEDVLPAPWAARSRVHEYGGGAFIVEQGTVYFINDADQDIYRLPLGEAPQRLTAQPSMRFADLCLDLPRNRLIAVAERFGDDDHATPENMLVSVPLDTATAATDADASALIAPMPLVEGADFYACPRLSPDGARLCWLSWNLPGMPWDETALHVATLAHDGGVPPLDDGDQHKRYAPPGVSAFQPTWLDAETLLFIGDASGWGNPYRWTVTQAEPTPVLPQPIEAEFGQPLWQFGMRTFALHQDRILATFVEHGETRLAAITPMTGAREDIPRAASALDRVTAYDGGLAAIAQRRDTPPAIAALPVGDDTAQDRLGLPHVLRPAAAISLRPGDIAQGEIVAFPGGDGATTYATFYAPRNADHTGPAGARPPLIVQAHGGPTASADRGLKLRTQFFTTRGFAVMDVDYAGSTGYGRAYRDRLDGRWGEADVADCEAAARFAAAEGWVAGDKLVIQGGSAGGYTALMAVATTKTFAAGSAHYGISDLELLLAHTHKFESGYLHRLLGTTPQVYAQTMRARSPLNLIGNVTAPVILFQGLEDKVVPPEQSERMANELEARGIDVAYHAYEGEGHGFRQATTIAHVLETEHAFLVRVLNLDAAA